MRDDQKIAHERCVVEYLNRLLISPRKAELRGRRIFLDDKPVSQQAIEWTEERKSIGWRSEPTGRWRLRVATVPTRGISCPFSEYSGPQPQMKSFPPFSDGTYRYDQIAEHIIAWNEIHRAWMTMRENKENNQELIAQLRDELGRLPAGVVIEESGSAETPVIVRVSVDRNLTKEQARAFVTKLRRVL